MNSIAIEKMKSNEQHVDASQSKANIISTNIFESFRNLSTGEKSEKINGAVNLIQQFNSKHFEGTTTHDEVCVSTLLFLLSVISYGKLSFIYSRTMRQITRYTDLCVELVQHQQIPDVVTIQLW